MKLNDLGKRYLELENDTRNFNIVCDGEIINTVSGEQRAEKFVESLKRKGVTAIIEADEPTPDKSARAKLDLNLRDRGHSVEKPKKGKGSYTRSDKHKKQVTEGPLVVPSESALMSMLDSFVSDWRSKKHTDEELEAVFKALGYKLEKDGQRSVITKEEKSNPMVMNRDGKEIVLTKSGDSMKPVFHLKIDGKDHGKFSSEKAAMQHSARLKEEDLEEAPGDIRKGIAAIAIIASLWGVNNHMAEKAYSASPQLQKLTAYLEVAKEHNDKRMIDQLEDRIENHKMRIDLGKGEVMGKDGNPIDVKYDKDAE